jgi:tellurite resistance protein TerC
MRDDDLAVPVPPWAWAVFAVVVAVSLVVDLVGHRGDHETGRKQAVIWSIVWIAVSLGFCAWIGIQFGRADAMDFLTAYLMEKSLSIDNLFVFLVVFSLLKIPANEQHRVLFWGIIGALVSRAIFIASGSALLARWHNIVYVLGAFLLYTAWKTARSHGTSDDGKPGDGENKTVTWLRKRLRITAELRGHHFVTREAGRLVGTPLLLALLTIELTDIAFALDSVPAVFSVTEDPFVVYTSNVFAILGMRALYIVLAGLLAGLVYLRYGLAAILALAGFKMMTSKLFHIPHSASLLAIVAILVASIVPSVIVKRRRERAAASA